MILRVVSGRVPEGKLDIVVDAYRRDYVPIAQQIAGRRMTVASAQSDGATAS